MKLCKNKVFKKVVPSCIQVSKSSAVIYTLLQKQFLKVVPSYIEVVFKK